MTPAARLNRRQFLRRTGSVLTGLSLMPLAGCEFNNVDPRVTGSEVPFLTPVNRPPSQGGFFVQNGGQAGLAGWTMPDLDRAGWTLTIDGLVDTPLTLTLADLEAQPAITVLKTMRCIIDSNEFPGLIGTALWRGVPLRPFLDQAGLDRDRTRRLRIYGHDGFTNNIRLDQVYGAFPADAFEPLLVTHMNGAPLAREHGHPVRLLIYDGYGYKNVKWLARIEATDENTAFGTYQEVIGYVDDGQIRVASKATNPVFNETLQAGPIRITGFAVSGAAPVAKVEVAIDDGPFAEARLISLDEILATEPDLLAARQFETAGRDAFPLPGVWVQWAYRWDATPGAHEIRVRATDASGATQPADDVDPFDGFNPIIRIPVQVRE